MGRRYPPCEGVAPSNLFEGDAGICSVLLADVIIRQEKIGEDDNILSEQKEYQICFFSSE